MRHQNMLCGSLSACIMACTAPPCKVLLVPILSHSPLTLFRAVSSPPSLFLIPRPSLIPSSCLSSHSFPSAASLTGFALWFSVSFPIVTLDAPSSATLPLPGGTQQHQGESFQSTAAPAAAEGANTAHPSMPGAHGAADSEGQCCQADQTSSGIAERDGSSSDSSEMLVLSTGPEDLQTHWQQVRS